MHKLDINSYGLKELSCSDKLKYNGGFISGVIVNTICVGILLMPVAAAAYMGWKAYE
jgi:hypothetical protein